jgi:hypothetical protein
MIEYSKVGDYSKYQEIQIQRSELKNIWTEYGQEKSFNVLLRKYNN